jgi:hypothetical protein
MTISYRLSTRRFGELVLEHGRATLDQIDLALRSKNDPRERLGQTLVRLGILQEGDVVELLAKQFNLPIAEASRLSLADPAIQLTEHPRARPAYWRWPRRRSAEIAWATRSTWSPSIPQADRLQHQGLTPAQRGARRPTSSTSRSARASAGRDLEKLI